MDGSLDDFSHTQSTPENTIIITLEESHVKPEANDIRWRMSVTHKLLGKEAKNVLIDF